MKEKIATIAGNAREASRKTAIVSVNEKNAVLETMSEMLGDRARFLIEENQRDLDKGRDKGLSPAMLERLRIDDRGIQHMRDGIRVIINLPDPIGEISHMKRLPNGLQIGKIRTPLGVIGIVYESRPNVTVDTASLCVKSGNAVILRGGSEAIHSNIALAGVLTEAISACGFPENAVQLIDTTDRQAIFEMLKMDTCIDLIIPRGGHELIRTVVENSVIPVIRHDKGLCHVYVDRDADLKMAEEVAFNAKTQRPSVCNACETLLVHQEISRPFLPGMVQRLQGAGVEVRGCEHTRDLCPGITTATEQDWDTEYLNLTLSVKVVPDLVAAIAHITRHGSMHTEAIITNNYQTSWRFVREVDAAAVFVNASTRFTDGGEFGLGAEMGISTQKLHCRGPMGLEELTSTRYIGFGNGQVRT